MDCSNWIFGQCIDNPIYGYFRLLGICQRKHTNDCFYDNLGYKYTIHVVFAFKMAIII